VGYGTERDSKKTGLAGILANLDRNRAEQGFNSLTNAWLILPMTISTDDAGTCRGDSGGPHFIHLDGVETDIVVSITVFGDPPCKATDQTYRMDTESARSFLADFVELP
jgi:secreted trypsin-like serine protease